MEDSQIYFLSYFLLKDLTYVIRNSQRKYIVKVKKKKKKRQRKKGTKNKRTENIKACI